MTGTGIVVRKATEEDLAALTRLDFTYPTERQLALERTGVPPELTFVFRYVATESSDALYQQYTRESLGRALARADLFLTALMDGQAVGLLMVLLPQWTDAGEITDLAVHRPYRRRGIAQALVKEAARWAQGRNLRALWVEPPSNNVAAIGFYLSLGFRLAGSTTVCTPTETRGTEGSRSTCTWSSSDEPLAPGPRLVRQMVEAQFRQGAITMDK